MNAMSTTQLMRRKGNEPFFLSKRENFAQIESKISSVHVLLLHDPSNTNIELEKAVRNYAAFGIKKITVARSDGVAFDKKEQRTLSKISFFSLSDSSSRKQSSIARIINTVFSSLKADKIFISWTDIEPYGMSIKALERNIFDCSLCMVPIVESSEHALIPTLFTPRLTFGSLKITRNNKNPLYPYTFFPYEYIGIYDRKNFLSLGGFNGAIINPWWQLFDFGVRAYKAQYGIRLSSYYRVRKSASKRKIFTPGRSTEKYRICLREAVGSRILNMSKCLLSDFRQLAYLSSFLFSKRRKDTVNFKKIIQEFWI